MAKKLYGARSYRGGYHGWFKVRAHLSGGRLASADVGASFAHEAAVAFAKHFKLGDVFPGRYEAPHTLSFGTASGPRIWVVGPAGANPERVLWWILSTSTTRTIFKGTISEATASVERSKYVGTPAALYGPYKTSRQAQQAARG
jgi:hypothetical protein